MGERQRTIEQFKVALAKASAVQQVLRLAVDELQSPHCDEHTASNVTTFATNFTVRQSNEIVHNLTGMP